jgi:hypothetical protein
MKTEEIDWDIIAEFIKHTCCGCVYPFLCGEEVKKQYETYVTDKKFLEEL